MPHSEAVQELVAAADRARVMEQLDPCSHPDFDWFNPDSMSDDPMDEVLACTSCGHVKWTAREIHPDLATTGGNNGN